MTETIVILLASIALAWPLGLYLARLYTEAQGGTVELDPSAPGARFVVRLPLEVLP